ncbi:uncharacterized protein LOC62_01G000569 [Vanrija pseudolonga]|uniref:Uncharacterized protein n=1 Tax=Vanrija pseudolonga TaxID=143232 RepID=A0AAF1BES2_9TREE|nr:hypothetical protein LOC62_01G000569 [Vanrija pseudolonga]
MTIDMLPSRDVDLFVYQEPASGWLRCPPEEANSEAPSICRDFSLVFVLRGETDNMEECGLCVAKQHMKAKGTLTIARRAEEEGAAPIVITIHLFTAQQWQGALVETEEMSPEWFSTNDIPYGQMFDISSFDETNT